MIILNTGYAKDLNLAAGEILTVSTTGNFKAEAISGLGISTGVIDAAYDGTKTYQYSVDGVIRITAYQKDCRYSIDQGRTALATKNDVYNAMTNGKMQAAYFGDSMTRLNYVEVTPYISYSDRGYFNWANAYLGQIFELVNANNGGVNGDTTALMLNRIETDVLFFNPKYCFVLAGYNDIVTGVSAASIIDNLTSIYRTIVNSGCEVFALAILPSTTFNTATKLETLATVNLWIRNYALRNNGVTFIDTYTPLLNPTSATGAPIANMINVDNIHPDTLGAQTMGKAIWSALKNLFSPLSFPQSLTDQISATNPLGNIIPNPVQQGSGAASGSVTGNVASGWQSLQSGAGASAVASKVARTDYPSMEWAQMVCTSVAGNDTGYYYYKTVSLPTGVAVGDTVYFECEVNVTDVSSTTLNQMSLKLISNSSGFNTALALGNNTGLIASTGSYILRTPNLPLLAGTTTLTMQVYFSLAAAAGSCTFQVGRCEVRKIS